MIEIDIALSQGAFRLEAAFRSKSNGVTALFGRSGAGKTTLVHAIAGLQRPDRGIIRIGDRILFSSEAGIDLPPERRRIGYVFQDGRLFPHLSVRGNLLYGAGGKKPSAAISLESVVALLGIEGLLERRPAALSGGEKQRVAIGRALLCQPELLLMDEPLASLDAPRKSEILPFIARLRDEIRLPIIYVSHAMEEIIRLADTLVILSEGRVAAVGGVEELTSRLDLRPLTGRYEAGAVIAVRLARPDAGDGLGELVFPGGSLLVPSLDLPTGTALRIRIRARDVALARQAPSDISMLNMLHGHVAEIAEESGSQVDIRLDIGTPEHPVALWSRVTKRSARDLGLAIGMPVIALIKAIAIDRASLGGFAPSRGEHDSDHSD